MLVSEFIYLYLELTFKKRMEMAFIKNIFLPLFFIGTFCYVFWLLYIPKELLQAIAFISNPLKT